MKVCKTCRIVHTREYREPRQGWSAHRTDDDGILHVWNFKLEKWEVVELA
ncbi:hypothetical protein L3Y19_gp009 [Gordonia phage Neville]|uniref:Uncharacterized protein n=1 Tax=Gordonia phage Neville TaxID=2301693 RepID=A0A385E0I7_9CAUD|nr:hypothetical protein L3Y19_gp009 [Gordonia phage Neville]AXQ64382.1 hypothetical protein SEA_NEVILLE_9 [Gordonia phage Neville]